MPTRPYTDSVRELVAADPDLKEAVLSEAAACFLNGEVETAKVMIHDFIVATIGFEELASRVNKTSSSIKRMFGPGGNPTMENLSIVLSTLKTESGGVFEVQLTR